MIAKLISLFSISKWTFFISIISNIHYSKLPHTMLIDRTIFTSKFYFLTILSIILKVSVLRFSTSKVNNYLANEAVSYKNIYISFHS